MLVFGGKIGQNRGAGNAWCGRIVIAIDIVHIFALLQLSPPSTSSLSNAHPAHVLEDKIGVQAMHGAVAPVRNVRHCLTGSESSGQFFVILIPRKLLSFFGKNDFGRKNFHIF